MILPFLAIALFSCNAQKKVVHAKPAPVQKTITAVDTFAAEKNKKGDAFPEINLLTWDNKKIENSGLIKNQPILFVLFNPGCGHCKEIVNAVKANLGMIKGANIIFVAGKPLQGQLPKFVTEMRLNKSDDIIISGDQGEAINKTFEYNGIPQIMIYNKEHKLEYIFYSEASMLEIQEKMYGQ